MSEERGAWVGYTVDRGGYTVRVYDSESREVESYSAVNSPLDSQIFIPLDTKEARVPLRTLRKFARQTAQEFATERGIPLAMVMEESEEYED